MCAGAGGEALAGSAPPRPSGEKFGQLSPRRQPPDPSIPGPAGGEGERGHRSARRPRDRACGRASRVEAKGVAGGRAGPWRAVGGQRGLGSPGPRRPRWQLGDKVGRGSGRKEWPLRVQD